MSLGDLGLHMVINKERVLPAVGRCLAFQHKLRATTAPNGTFCHETTHHWDKTIRHLLYLERNNSHRFQHSFGPTTVLPHYR